MVKMDQLVLRRKHQQKDYYGSQAKEMFIDGRFNLDNWNGGDGVIRQYFYNNEHKSSGHEIDLKFNGIEYSVDLIITHTWYNDSNYATIIIKGWQYYDKEECDEIEHVAYFNWYKSRGKTDMAMYNGNLMSEQQYLFILNLIEQTGFEFDLEVSR
ncbi:hypothetical protein AAXE64_07590 [Priestia megaterium]